MFNTYSSFRDKQKADSLAITQLESALEMMTSSPYSTDTKATADQREQMLKNYLALDKKIKVVTQQID